MTKDLRRTDELLVDFLICQLQECCRDARGLSEHLPADHPKIRTLKAAMRDLKQLLYNHIDGWEQQ